MKLKMMICSSQINGSEEEIKILPIGLVKSQKGNFLVDDESVKLMQNTFKSRGLDIVVDYEHQTLDGVQAPAGGWIKDFYIKDNAVVAKVEWTEKAKEYIANKEYRYLSPVVMVRKTDGKAAVLHSVALTNTPAIDGMYPIVNSFNVDEDEGDEMMELLEQLIKILGLNEGATEEEVIAKLQGVVNAAPENSEEMVANKEVLTMLDLKDGAKIEDVKSKIMQLKNPAGHVSQEEFNQLRLKLEKKEAEDLVEVALKEGKLTAAQKEWALEYALKAPEGFKQYIKTATQVVPVGELGNPPEQKKKVEMDMKACKMLGVSQADIEKYGKDEE